VQLSLNGQLFFLTLPGGFTWPEFRYARMGRYSVPLRLTWHQRLKRSPHEAASPSCEPAGQLDARGRPHFVRPRRARR
jgi:hypothetical protein